MILNHRADGFRFFVKPPASWHADKSVLENPQNCFFGKERPEHPSRSPSANPSVTPPGGGRDLVQKLRVTGKKGGWAK
jgi:hypothetical protein